MMVRSKCQPQIMRHAYEADPESGLLDYATRCPCGVQYCRITPDGKVTPCPYMPVEAGDLASESFGAIWRGSRVFRELRAAELGGRCGRCEFRVVCGGCRARAFAEEGDWLAEDPACSYEPTGRVPVVEPRLVTYGAAARQTLTVERGGPGADSQGSRLRPRGRDRARREVCGRARLPRRHRRGDRRGPLGAPHRLRQAEAVLPREGSVVTGRRLGDGRRPVSLRWPCSWWRSTSPARRSRRSPDRASTARSRGSAAAPPSGSRPRCTSCSPPSCSVCRCSRSSPRRSASSAGRALRPARQGIHAAPAHRLQRDRDLGRRAGVLPDHALPAVLGPHDRDLRGLDVDLRGPLLHRVVHALPLLLRLGPLEEGAAPRSGHWTLGILLNVWGTAVLFIADSWLTYMMSPPAERRRRTPRPRWSSSGARSPTRPGCRSTSTA